MIVIFSLVLCSYLTAQENFNKKMSIHEQKEDFEIFRNTLTSIHPNLYLYTPKSTLDSMLFDLEAQLNEPLSPVHFFRLLTPIIHAVRNSHTTIRPPESFLDYVRSDVNRLPMKFIYRNDSLIVVDIYAANYRIKSGDVVTKINGIPAAELMDSLAQYTFIDGYNQHYSNYLSSIYLSRRYAYFIGEPSQFIVEFYDSNGNIEKEYIESLPIEAFNPEKNTRDDKKKYNFKIENNIAYITVRDFTIEKEQKFKKDLNEYFKQITRQNIEYLVLDLRDNRGGNPENTDNLLRFFIKEKVYPIKEKFSLIDDLAGYEHILIDDAYKYFQRSKKGSNSNGVYILEDEINVSIKPNRHQFKGKLVVLINENCASATTSFLGQIRTHVSEAVFIGNTTLGNPYIVVADYMVSLKLPNSDLIVKIPLVSSEKNVDFQNPRGGVEPDIVIPTTLEDLKGKTDNVMKEANKIIMELKNNRTQ